MNTIRNCIVVFIIPEQGIDAQSSEASRLQQHVMLQDFLEKNPDVKVLDTFNETVKKQKNKNRWNQLKAALNYSSLNNCDLIIPELKQYHGITSLSNLLINFINDQKQTNLYCLDQTFINSKNLHEIILHLQARRKKHGELIKQGLTRTQAKSGNPRAAEVISKVNRPKILSSIVFSLMIEPIVNYMEQLKYPQRKMVQFLNNNNFSAPEGGRWVLSQFQKVYDRVRLNRVAMTVGASLLHELKTYSPEEIAANLNFNPKTPSPKGSEWTAHLVLLAAERYQELLDIQHLSDSSADFLPALGRQHLDDFDINQILIHPSITKFFDSKLTGEDKLLKQA